MKFFSTLVASTLGVLIAAGIMLFLFVLFVVALTAGADPKPVVQKQSVLVVDLSGSIPERGAADPIIGALQDEPMYGIHDLTRSVRLAKSDDRIKALWIRASGASIPWASLQEIRSAILDFKESGKAVVASSNGSLVGEDEYFVMSVADSLYAVPGAPFEFNGFYINAEFYKRALDKLAVEPQIIRAGKFKGAVEPYTREQLSAENEQQLRAILDQQQQSFVEAVASSRGVGEGSVNTLMAKPSIVTSDDAFNAGLIDRLAYRDEVVDVLRALTESDEDDDVPLVGIESYARLSPRDVGLRVNSKNEIALLFAEGTIVGGRSNSNSSVGSATFNKAVKRIRNRDAVKAVVLRINSPGGSATASDEMLRELRLLAAEKPLVVSMGSVAASGGYWIATAADSIVADPLTLTGSIGVYSMFFDVGDLFTEKLGVDFDAVRTSPNADMLSGLRALTESERAALAKSVDQTYDRFLDIVSDSRSMSVESVDAIAQGRVWTGTDAVEQGLVDVLGGLKTTIGIAGEMVDLEEGDFAVVSYPRPETFFEQLTSRMESALMARIPRTPVSTLRREAVSRVQLLEETLRDAMTVQARLPYTIQIN
ncbi:MAG: signal peptide peptidase SppA [Rhodothermales bacterium]|nr:signal peptide peptidase SppA [Rhodothermales bacterium]